MACGSLLAGTDILTTVPDYTAQYLAASGGLRIEEHPLRSAAGIPLHGLARRPRQ